MPKSGAHLPLMMEAEWDEAAPRRFLKKRGTSREAPQVIFSSSSYSAIWASRKYGTFNVERQKPVTSGLIIM